MSTTEMPIGWRVCIQPINVRPFDREFEPGPRYSPIMRTKEEAEVEQRHQQALLGGCAVIHIQPVYVSSAKRGRIRQALQESLTAAGWPIQVRPPRPGIRDRRGRRK
jgi:hypothetical protein